MKHKLFALLSLLVIIAMITPLGGVPARAGSDPDSSTPDDTTTLYHTNLPLVQRAFEYLPPIIEETTEVLPEETLQNLTEISDTGVFTFSEASPALEEVEVGDVIVGDVSAAAEYGFLREVTGITSESGQVILETQEATIEDAIQQGTINLSKQLTPADVVSMTAMPGVTMVTMQGTTIEDSFFFEINDVVLYDGDGDYGTTGDQIKANGSFELAPDIDFNAVFENNALKDLVWIFTVEETAELEFQTEVDLLDFELYYEITRLSLGTIWIWVGPVPVVILIEMPIYLRLDGKVSVGITTGVTQQAHVRAGLSYEDGTWSPISGLDNSFSFNPPTLSAGGSLKGYIDPPLGLLLYGIAGPFAAVNPYIKLEADVFADPWWELYGGLDATVGVSAEILGRSLGDYTTVVVGYKILLDQAETNLPPDMPAIPFPSDGAIDQSTGIILRWTGGDQDGDAVTYDVYFEAGDDTPDILVSIDQSGTTYDPGILTYNTQYYWQIVAQDEHGATTSGLVWDFTTETLDPGERIYIPAGEFQMGCDPLHNGSYPCWSDELPLHPVYLSAYLIDRTEVTNSLYSQCVSAGACTTPFYNSSLTRTAYYDNPVYAGYPVISVDWNQAQSFCTWIGGSLPTEAQWEKAARGSADTRAFPWGDISPDCTLANYHTEIGACVGDTSAVGSYLSGASPYGLLNMAGNVWEWVNDWYQSDYYENSPYENPTGPDTGTNKVVRGGGFDWGDIGLHVAFRFSYPTYYEVYAIGFRCAYPPVR